MAQRKTRDCGYAAPSGRVGNGDGFTLVEVLIAVLLVGMMAVGLFATGSMVRKMTQHNRASLAARALGIQRLEEITAGGIEDITKQAPYPTVTNRIQFGGQVISAVDVTGHDGDRTVVTNLADSVYLEVHVDVSYASPLTGGTVTNSFSAVVR